MKERGATEMIKSVIYPCSMEWEAGGDKTTTVSEFLESSSWDGETVSVAGYKRSNYQIAIRYGASPLFQTRMNRDLAIKFFGNCELLSATLSPRIQIEAKDREHLMEWAKKNSISNLDELVARFHEYRERFPNKCFWGGTKGYLTIAVE